MYDLDTTHVVLSGAGVYKKLHTDYYISPTSCILLQYNIVEP